MAVKVAVVGIDGSGKSTVVSALPRLLAAKLGLLVAAAGDDLHLIGPEEDHLTAGFAPDGLSWIARVARWLKRFAKSVVNHPAIYPIVKILQLAFQDHACRQLERRRAPDVVVSDGTLLLAAMGRAANYRDPARQSAGAAHAPSPSEFRDVLGYLLDGREPPGLLGRFGFLPKARRLLRGLRGVGLDAGWLPDVVVMLDVDPALASARISTRGERDLHENVRDLAQARLSYLAALEGVKAYRPETRIIGVDANAASPGETLGRIARQLEPLLEGRTAQAGGRAPLGTTDAELSGGGFWRKVLSSRYLVRYMVGQFFRGAWREPFFFFSRSGRQFLREGYSANVMRSLYEPRPGLFERIFQGYPLHRAVRDRLGLLTRRIEPELRDRLVRGDEVRIFTAPSGFAFDLFRPLAALRCENPEWMKRVHLVAADLDPHGTIATELLRQADRLGIRFTFLKGDLTRSAARRRFARHGPFDLALFVGISAWLPKPATLRHLGWLAENLREDGVLVTDVFTPAAYALSGKYVGYRAHYYAPETFQSLLEVSGFEGASCDSGPDGINHVLVARPGNQRTPQPRLSSYAAPSPTFSP